MRSPGGRYRVDARFTNVSGQSLCGMSAAVLTLQGASGSAPVVLKPNGASAGGAGAVVLASEAGTSGDLEPLGQATFSFLIGLRQKEPFTFFVNLQGEPFGPSCR